MNDRSEEQIVVAATNKKQQQRLWTAMGQPDLATTDRTVRTRNAAEHIRVLSELFKLRTARHWENDLQAHHVPACRVCTIADAVREPQFAARDLIHHHTYVPGVDGPLSVPVAGFKYEHGGPRKTNPPPRVGEHTRELLHELGYDESAIVRLCQAGATMTVDGRDLSEAV